MTSRVSGHDEADKISSKLRWGARYSVHIEIDWVKLGHPTPAIVKFVRLPVWTAPFWSLLYICVDECYDLFVFTSRRVVPQQLLVKDMRFSQSPWLPPAVAIAGALPVIFSTRLLIDPLKGLPMLGYDIPTDTKSRRLSSSIMRFSASRDLTVGLLTLAAWWEGNTRTMGVVTALGAVKKAIDGFVNEADVSGAGLKHWLFVPVDLIIGGALMGWFDGLF